MRILFLAPQPFFQERGTPIAVRLALEVIADRYKHKTQGEDFKIDLLCYHEGEDLLIPGVEIKRIDPPGFIRSYLKNITPGISLKKLVCDVFFFFKAVKLVFFSRRKPYELIHAVEESVFIAMLLKFFTHIPYIYDMDSSLALQVTEKWVLLKPLYPFLSFFEKSAVKHSLAVAPVCDSLGIIAEKYGAKSMVVLRDISLLNGEASLDGHNLREQLNIPAAAKIFLYVGNLEAYQGIDLMIESFRLVKDKLSEWHTVIIGGNEASIASYNEKAKDLFADSRLIFAGPRPVAMLGNYIKQADILLSPRTKGNNTPMKIFSYLHSGKALIATNLPTHTQVLSTEVSKLPNPVPEDYAEAMYELAVNTEERERLAQNAYRLAEENYTFDIFSKELNRLYDLTQSNMLK